MVLLRPYITLGRKYSHVNESRAAHWQPWSPGDYPGAQGSRVKGGLLSIRAEIRGLPGARGTTQGCSLPIRGITPGTNLGTTQGSRVIPIDVHEIGELCTI